MNLEGLMNLARLGEHVGVDLWKFETPDGRGIRRAILFLEPFASGAKDWTYKQISPRRPERFQAILRKASRRYKDAEFQKMAASISQHAGS
jgi:hypothetical protein